MLVGVHLARLDTAARLILRDAELARDAVQEATLRAWRNLRGLRDPGRFDAWLHRLTVNACLDLARQRRGRVIEVELTPLHDAPVPDASAQVTDADYVERMLAGIDPAQRAVVVLHYYLDLSLPETAAALGIPLGTAKSRLNRALDAMRIRVAGDELATATATPGAVRMNRPDTPTSLPLGRSADAPPSTRSAAPARPDYLDDIVAQARRTRQRPAWTFPERWLPMTIALRPAAVPRAYICVPRTPRGAAGPARWPRSCSRARRRACRPRRSSRTASSRSTPTATSTSRSPTARDTRPDQRPRHPVRPVPGRPTAAALPTGPQCQRIRLGS